MLHVILVPLRVQLATVRIVAGDIDIDFDFGFTFGSSSSLSGYLRVTASFVTFVDENHEGTLLYRVVDSRGRWMSSLAQLRTNSRRPSVEIAAVGVSKAKITIPQQLFVCARRIISNIPWSFSSYRVSREILHPAL